MNALPYRMVVSVAEDYGAAVTVAEQRFDKWLADKGYNVGLPAGGCRRLGPHALLHHEWGDDGTTPYTRWYLRETLRNDWGTWKYTVVLAPEGHSGAPTWLQLDVKHQPAAPESSPARALKPRLVDSLLDSFDVRDGLAAVKATPQTVGSDQVDRVISELTEPSRKLPIVMTATPGGQEPRDWTDQVARKVFRHLPGLAVTYVLTQEAAAEFNRALEFHQVRSGSFRTYLPELDPAWKPDASRHPVLGRRAAETDMARAARLLSLTPQSLALSSPLPSPLGALCGE